MITTAQAPPSDDLDDDDKKPNARDFVPWDRIKVRLDTKYDAGLGPNDVREIKTKVFLGNNEEPEKTPLLTDVEKLFMWNCTAQFVLNLNKAWIKKIDDKACSITIKCLQLGVTEQPEHVQNTGVAKQLNKRLFPMSTQANPVVAKKPEPVESKDEEDDDDDEDEEEEDASGNQPSNPPTKADESEKEESDQEEDEGEEEEDEEESEEEPVKPAKSTKAPAKAPASAPAKAPAKAPAPVVEAKKPPKKGK
jgi:hypothetical protein